MNEIKYHNNIGYRSVEAPLGLCRGCVSWTPHNVELCEEKGFECCSVDREDGKSVIWINAETPMQSSPTKTQIYKTPFYHKDGFIFDANHNCLMTDGQICRTIDKVGVIGYNHHRVKLANEMVDKITQAIVDALNQSYKE